MIYPINEIFIEPDLRVRHKISWFKDELLKSKEDPDYGDPKEIRRKLKALRSGG